MGAKLPMQQTDDKDLSLMQSTWASAINPVLSNPITQGALLRNVQLSTGANVVNHLLGRKLVGWHIARQRSAGTVYDTQDSNTMPSLTLLLTSSSNMTVDLYVF